MNRDDDRLMRLIRTTVPSVAAMATVGALVLGVVISSVEARHHHRSSHRPLAASAQTLSVSEQQSLAHQLDTMTLPRGITHTTVCPSFATPTDACFAGTLSKPPTDALIAAGDAERMLTAIGVTLGTHVSCVPVTGGPLGSGFNYTADATWRGVSLSTLVFVSNEAQKHTDARGLAAIVSVQATKA